MRLNHVNLTVTDVAAAGAFLETFFELASLGGNAGMMVLQDEGGSVLTLMKAGRNADVSYPPMFHIGFFLADEGEVDRLHRRMREAGHDAPVPERNNHAYGFYVAAPGGFTVEVGA